MKINRIYCILIGCVLVMTAFSAAALAGSANGFVRRVLVHSPGVVMFDVGAHNSRPACSTVGNEWAFNLDKPRGRAMYALLLSATNLDIPVGVQGTGKCSAWGDREDVYFLYMDP